MKKCGTVTGLMIYGAYNGSSLARVSRNVLGYGCYERLAREPGRGTSLLRQTRGLHFGSGSFSRTTGVCRRIVHLAPGRTRTC